MKCALGSRKLRRIAAALGQPVASAYVRGGWEHGIAEVWTASNKRLYIRYFPQFEVLEWKCPFFDACSYLELKTESALDAHILAKHAD